MDGFEVEADHRIEAHDLEDNPNTGDNWDVVQERLRKKFRRD
jgi:hypothetical protein